MASLKDNVAKVVKANADIKSAIAAKGVDVSDYSRLSQAAAKIAAIPTGLDAQTIADAVSAMDGTAHAADETADALAASIKTITRRGDRRKVMLANADGTETTLEDIAAMTWDVTPGVNAFAVCVSDTFPDGTARPRGLQFTLGWHQMLSGRTTYTVDWGDGTKSVDISETNPVHTYAKAGVYKIEVSDDFSAWGFWIKNENQDYWNEGVPVYSGSEVVEDGHTKAFWCVDNRSKAVRLLRIGDSVTGIDRIAQWCKNLTGQMPDWPDKVTSAQMAFAHCHALIGRVPEWNNITFSYFTYYGCSGLTGRVPEWPESVREISWCFSDCSGLTGAVPAWPKTFKPAWGSTTSIGYVYSGCSGLTGSVPAWPDVDNVTDLDHTFYGCSGLTGAVPAWGAAITNAQQTFYGCSGLTGSVPAWGAAITNAQSCYQWCAGLTTVWDESATDEDLMPSKITAKTNCFAGCDNRLRAFFLTAWGGTRAT